MALLNIQSAPSQASLSFGSSAPQQGGISVSGGFEDDLKKRMALAAQQGWSQDQIDRSALLERTMYNQQQAQQQQQQQVDDANTAAAKKPSGLKSLLVNGGAILGDTLAGIGSVAAAPFTGGASLAGGFAAGAGIEALRRKLLGEKQSLGSSLLEGGLTILPGIGEARKAIQGTKLAADVAGTAGSEAANIATPDAISNAPGMFSKTIGKLFGGGQDAAQVAAPAAENATTRTAQIAPELASKAKPSFTSNIADQFKPQAGDTNILDTAGSDLRGRARGVVTGAGSGADKMMPATADATNQFLDSIGAKGSVAKQLERVQSVRDQAGNAIGQVIDKSNAPVTQDTLSSIQDAVKNKILGDNGNGIAGFHVDTHGQIAQDMADQLNKITDTKGLQNFKQSLDDAINYGRKTATPDPMKEQIAQAFRGEVSGALNSAVPEAAPYNQLYSGAKDAEGALLGQANPAGLKVPGLSFNGKGLGGQTIQAIEDKLGQGLQTVGNTVSTPVIKQAAKQFGERTILGDQQATGNVPLTPDQMMKISQGVNAAKNGGLPFPSDTQDPDQQAMNQLAQSGAKTFQDYATGIQQLETPQAPGGAGGTGGAASPGFTRADLVAAASKVLADPSLNSTQQKDQLANLSAMSSLLDSQDKANAASGTSADGTKLTTAQQKDIASVKNAGGLLDAIESQFNQAGGAKGPVAGFLTTRIPGVSSYTAPKFAAYNDTKIDAATAYAQALAGGGRQPGEAIIMEVKKALPDPEDTPIQAAQKLANLRQHLAHREQTVLNYPYTSSDLPGTQNTIDQLLGANALGQ